MFSATVSKGFVGTARISELIWKRVPDSGSADRECATAECAACIGK